MKLIIAIVLTFLLNSSDLDKGCAGIYYIQGTAYSQDGSTIKNEVLKITKGKLTIETKTSKEGRFTIEVPWITACPSGRTKKQHREDNRILNAENLFISCSNYNLTIENRWETYAFCLETDMEKITWKHDLVFK